MPVRQIRIAVGKVELTAELRNTATANAIYAQLPIRSKAQTWGDEIYFSVPVAAKLEKDAKQIVEPGELAFWVQGSSIAIGFGPTPISQGNEIRLTTKANIWATTADDVKKLKQAQEGDPITVEAMP